MDTQRALTQSSEEAMQLNHQADRYTAMPRHQTRQFTAQSAHLAVHHCIRPKAQRQVSCLTAPPHRVEASMRPDNTTRACRSSHGRRQGQVLHQWHECLQDSKRTLVQHLLQRQNPLPHTKHLGWAHAHNLWQTAAGAGNFRTPSGVG